MTVMTMKEISKFLENSKGKDVPDTIDGLQGRIAEINEVIESLAETSVNAQEIILKKMTEKQFAEFMNSVAKITTFTCISNGVSNGKGVGLMMAIMSGELQGYTHSVILATIGALINEEILEEIL